MQHAPVFNALKLRKGESRQFILEVNLEACDAILKGILHLYLHKCGYTLEIAKTNLLTYEIAKAFIEKFPAMLNDYLHYKKDVETLGVLVTTFVERASEKGYMKADDLILKQHPHIRLEINNNHLNEIFLFLINEKFNVKVISLQTNYEICSFEKLQDFMGVLDQSLMKFVGDDITVYKAINENVKQFKNKSENELAQSENDLEAKKISEQNLIKLLINLIELRCLLDRPGMLALIKNTGNYYAKSEPTAVIFSPRLGGFINLICNCHTVNTLDLKPLLTELNARKEHAKSLELKSTGESKLNYENEVEIITETIMLTRNVMTEIEKNASLADSAFVFTPNRAN